jgi:sulfate-transporting ATPase
VLDANKTVLDNVLNGVADKMALLQRHTELSARTATELTAAETAELNALKEQLDAARLWGLDKRVLKAMRALRCPPSESAVTNLSGGERRCVTARTRRDFVRNRDVSARSSRVALCQLLVSQPDILLLDEPTNHLDATVALLRAVCVVLCVCGCWALTFAHAQSVAWLQRYLQQYKGTVIGRQSHAHARVMC